MRTDLSVNNGINFQSSWYDKFFKSIPQKDVNNVAQFNKVGSMLASPHYNRLALGVAAISSQPFMDYFNPKVDRDTATASAIRTTSKIAVCTTVGFAVRGACYNLVDKYVHGSEKEGSTLLTPNSILQEKSKELRNAKLKLHKNAMSTVTALGVMLFTNFLLDAPLTTKVSNFWLKKTGLANSSEEGIYA